MRTPRRAAGLVFVCLCVVASAWTLLSAQDAPEATKPERPDLSLRVRPQTGIAPVDISATAEFRGGSDDFEEYYCATVEWEWGDGSLSEVASDCDPYEPGRSEIDRFHTARHTYRYGGTYRVTFRLKQRDDVVAFAASPVRLSGGGGQFR